MNMFIFISSKSVLDTKNVPLNARAYISFLFLSADGGAFQSLISFQNNISFNTFKKGNWRFKVAESKYIVRIHSH